MPLLPVEGVDQPERSLHTAELAAQVEERSGGWLHGDAVAPAVADIELDLRRREAGGSPPLGEPMGLDEGGEHALRRLLERPLEVQCEARVVAAHACAGEYLTGLPDPWPGPGCDLPALYAARRTVASSTSARTPRHGGRGRPGARGKVKDMRRISPIASALVALLAAFALLVPVAVAKGGGSIRQIALHPGASFPAAKGKAASKVKGAERELQIEVEHVRRLAGKRVNVFVNGVKLGSPRVSGLGAVEVERNTELGQKVPRIAKGSTVRVRTLGGKLIARGRF